MPADLRPLAVSLGEPAGIGPDLAVHVWQARLANRGLCPRYVVVGDAETLRARARLLQIDLSLKILAAEDSTHQPDLLLADDEDPSLLVVDCPLEAGVTLGEASVQTAQSVIDSLETALDLTRRNATRGLVTLPIQKRVLLEIGFPYPGHTNWLEARLDAEALMLFVSQELKVAPVTVHLPLSKVGEALAADTIISAAKILHAGLQQDFGVASPKIAIAALNPHAGEGGSFGGEEQEVIAPAVAAMNEQGIPAVGPLPADTLFHEEARRSYDAVLAMYHDQALIPLKTLDFWSGCQISLGLPIVRTSPDHGTAFSLAGKGTARPESFIAALNLADAVAQTRAVR